jgi:hypothetical protein
MKSIVWYAIVISWNGDAIYMRKRRKNEIFIAPTLDVVAFVLFVDDVKNCAFNYLPW